MKTKKIVAVGISGGVDSAMAALLLLQQGYEVIGLTMAIWDDSIPIDKASKKGCFGPGEAENLKAAEELCHKLGIKHHIIRLKAEYRENVLSYFCSTYSLGKTPNPCIVCNQRIKFGLLPLKAKEAGIEFDYFATGHYVQISYDDKIGRYQLRRANDNSKDQSYFLAYLKQDQLHNLLFPLGDKTKNEIKRFAEANGFAELSNKQESQDFLETDDISILFDKASLHEGDIVDFEGKFLAKHSGIINFTIGQRRNLGISGLPEPYYVIDIDGKTNTVTVGPKSYLYKHNCIASEINWLSVAEINTPFSAQARIRLQHKPAECMVTPLVKGTLQVAFVESQLSITPGQGIVFYDGDMVLAGGIIDTI
ncbi:MAG: tRNA 2-thiouridine(34) synthase MnmA [Candidatus Cloacimonetes bacterium]|nr:tRNA 2-thiouridine(34) synthase MnmA [Candidatus Cloacimonadota bacterium]